MIALSVEERIHILRARLAGVMADFEIAPFIDTGQVFNSFKNVSFKDYRITPGIGFRGIIRPNVVGRIDYGLVWTGSSHISKGDRTLPAPMTVESWSAWISQDDSPPGKVLCSISSPRQGSFR